MIRALPFVLLSIGLAACGSAATGAQPNTSPSHAAPRYDAAVLADHPVGYWRLGEASGTTLVDRSGHGNDGVYAGSYQLGQVGAIAGDADTATVFGGQSGATVPSSRNLVVGNQVTIELWLKKRSEAFDAVFVAKNGACVANAECFQLLNHLTSGQMEFRVIADPGSALVSNSSLSTGDWHYVVATYDGGQARLYVDGALDGSRAITMTPSNAADPWSIGRRADGYFADGTLDEVAVYGTALTAEQVSAHWRAAGH